VVTDFVGAHSGDQVQAARVVVRVEHINQADQVVGVHARADLDPDRIVHATQKLDVSAVQLASAVANPQHVR